MLLLLVCVQSQAQISNASNLKHKKISTHSTVILDVKSIVPFTFQIKNVDTSYYIIDPITTQLIWKKALLADSVEVSYRTFETKFNQTLQRFNYDSIKNNFIASKPISINNNYTSQYDANNSFLDFGKINYSGSFGRNLSFGNNQDAVFNSQLNLQMNGFIGDSIEMMAAITDNNIPIQPDGTTQRLNEFDKILLQFKKQHWQLNLGDIDLRQNQNYFLNFYKRLQGASYLQESKNGARLQNKFLVAGAIAKGKFNRNVFNGQEGNQGPYRLQGANSEIYFIVLAGTERVFIDGELLFRGEDQDYVINYNTAEVTFTPKRMITKDRRIQIEFEYAERSFLNSLFYVSNEMQVNKKLKISIAAYTNSDAKNSSINQQLDAKQKQFLANIGNNALQAFYPYESIDSFSTTKILYAKRVSPINNNDSIYVYSTNKDSARYSLIFTEVGVNKGNYVALFNGNNGKVYQWIAPIAGVAQGNYEAAQFLITPKTQQIIATSIAYNISNKTTINTDFAISNYDINTFSNYDKSNNKGIAGKVLIQHTDKFKKTLQLNSILSYELVNKNFKPLERIRSVEFSRDWGLPIINTSATEQLPKISFELTDNKNNLLKYIAEGYIRSDAFNGFRHTLQNVQTIDKWQLKTNISFVKNNTPELVGYFFKPNVEVAKTFKQFKSYSIGMGYSLEQNEQRFKQNDTIVPSSFSFSTVTAFIKSNQSKNNKWSFNYFTRFDYLPYKNSFQKIDRSNNYNLTTELLQNNHHQFKVNITYRTLEVINAAFTNLKADNSLLGRIQYNINEWNGFVNGNVLYELGAGQEQRRDFSYLEVPAGRGQYTWNDYNADGIAQLNEFELALFQDQAKYIRIYTPTNQFVKANYNQFNYNINIMPRSIAASINNKNLREILSKIIIQSSLQTSKKIISDGNFHINPFKTNFNDTALINLTNIFTNTISINRISAVWGIDVTNINNYNKALLTYGLESRKLNNWIIKARTSFKKSYTLEVMYKYGNNELSTPQFNNRNYDIASIQTEPKFIYTNLTKYRLQFSYQNLIKQNSQAFGGERAVANSLNFEGKYNSVQSNSLIAKFTFTNIEYIGQKNTTTSYIMLDGLLPGKNYLWNIEFTKRLNNNFEISFNYEGRKPGESRVINIGRASIRAIL